MYPILFQIGSFTVTSFGVMIALSFIAGGWMMARGLKQTGEDPEIAWDLIGYAAVFGILGAKIYYMILHWPETAADPVRAVLSRAGLVWYGGFILAALVIAWRVRSLKLPLGKYADAAGPTLALGYGIGRLGCFLVGDDYGAPTSSAVGIAFPNGAPPSTAGNLRAFGVDVPASVPDSTVLAVHPTQLYEVGMSLIILAILLRLRPRLASAPGALFGIWLALAGVERFIVEIFRAKDDRFLGAFSVAQLISVLLVALGIAIAGTLLRRSSPVVRPATA
jgi:phosphatidylglycerol---prolipoprotein diacylglyceryl transferase